MGATKSVRAPAGHFEERTLVMVLADLAGFSRVVGHLQALEIAAVLDRFYAMCGEQVAAREGRVVKFSGDNCLAVFDAVAARDAVGCAVGLRDAVWSLGAEEGLDLDLGANVHLATVATGRFGGEWAPSDDVIGVGVIHTYRMGAGPGIRISEPVYRKLPSDERGSWRKHQPPATYSLEP
jgi:class 3 adenylate cyclase